MRTLRNPYFCRGFIGVFEPLSIRPTGYFDNYSGMAKNPVLVAKAGHLPRLIGEASWHRTPTQYKNCPDGLVH